MAALSDFFPSLRLEIPGALDLTLEREVRRSAIRACQETWLWKELVSLTTTAGTAAYSLEIPDGADLVGVVCVYDSSGTRRVGFETDLLSSQISFFSDPGSKTYSITVALQPSTTATIVPDLLLSHYPEVVQAGALSELYAMPNKPWSSKDRSLFYHKKFKVGVGNARIAMYRSQSGGGLRIVSPRPFL